MDASNQWSIRERQKESLLNMFNLSEGGSSSDDVASQQLSGPWKVVVFDRDGGDVLALVTRIGDLRRHGVTLTLHLDSPRQPIPDAPAVYFVTPTREVVQRVAQDVAGGLYDSFYLHSTDSMPREVLEDLAQSCAARSCAQRVRRVYDQHARFLCLESDLFSLLGHDDCFVRLNDPAVSDAQAEALVDSLVKSLFCVLVTLKTVPVIRAQRGGAAELVAQKLHGMLQSRLASPGGAELFGGGPLQRSLLVLVDRSLDLGAMMAHPWTYRSLVHELLDYRLNRVKFVPVRSSSDAAATTTTTTSSTASSSDEVSYDIDTMSDRFWAAHAGDAFPGVPIEIGNEGKALQAASADLSQLSSTCGVDMQQLLEGTGGDKVAEMEGKGLSKFVDRLPALRETKRLMTVHADVCKALLEQIKAREISTFFQLEETLITQHKSTGVSEAKEVLAVVTGSGPQSAAKRPIGTVQDRLRLYAVWYLSARTIPADLAAQMEQALERDGADTKAIAFIKRHRSFLESAAVGGMTTAGTSSSITPDITSSTPPPERASFSSGWLSFDSVLEKMYSGVKSLLPKSTNFPVTRVVDSLLEMRNGSAEDASYLYLDPKIATKQVGPGAAPVPRKTTPFRDALVFVVGGGSYVEYQNLMEYCRRSSSSAAAVGVVPGSLPVPGKRIIYGSTAIIHPRDFLQQLSTLGQK